MQIVYLHGFASGPTSKKGVAFAEHFAKRGHAVERADLRVPSFEHLRLSAMIDHVRALLTGPAILVGSSLGGLTAARVAERDDRVQALVLLAPAFCLVERWREQLGAEWADWQRTGWREVIDHTTGRPAKIDYGFIEDCERVDVGWPAAAQPALIVHGTGDDVVPIARSRDFAKRRPGVRLVEVADDHELTASIPTILSEADQFLARWL